MTRRMRGLSIPFLAFALGAGAITRAADGPKTVHPPPGSNAEWRPGEVIVAFRPGVERGDVVHTLQVAGARQARAARQGSTYLVSLAPGMTVPEAIGMYGAMRAVDYVEPNGILRKTQSTSLRPNDEYFPEQWNMALVNAERTWAIQTGSRSVAVAVLDTGVAYEDYVDPVTGRAFGRAPDWGDVRFLPGVDTVNRDAHPNDDEWHGTHVASTIAEGTNNALGYAGLAFGCAIMPVKVLDERGVGTFFEVAEGIDYAASYTEGAERPVRVINMNFGVDRFSETIKRALDRASANGIVLVAAGGNASREGIDFPASLPNVIAAGAVDARGERAAYSNTGAELELMGPGGDCERDDDRDGLADCVFQQMPDPDLVALGIYNRFCFCGLDGTSMATPHVSAAAALLISQGITDSEAVRAALQQTASKIGGASGDGRNDSMGYGLIQPASALSGLGLNQGPVR